MVFILLDLLEEFGYETHEVRFKKLKSYLEKQGIN